jgi:uncharacterized protein (TIGR02001 family)
LFDASIRGLPATTRCCLVLLVGLVAAPLHCMAGSSWGGSAGLTSDYLVRGVSRSNDNPAVQGDLHFANDLGFLAGVFASSVEIVPGEGRNAELSPFVGFAWNARDAWHGKIVASHYSYPWNRVGSRYNYDEFSLDAAYREWLDVSVIYSPNSPRYVPHAGLVAVTSKTAELNLQAPWRRLTAAAGLGFTHLDGPQAGGYAYWSLGAVFELAPLSFSLSYVDTAAAATSLYYDAASRGRWTATVLWRF